MATRLHSKLVKNLTTEEYKRCHHLNLRGNGDMMYTLIDARRNSRPYRTYMLKDDDGRLLAWALVFDGSAYFYVRKSMRRQGFGRRLINRVTRDFPGVIVYPHDPTSRDFFKQFKDKVVYK